MRVREGVGGTWPGRAGTGRVRAPLRPQKPLKSAGALMGLTAANLEAKREKLRYGDTESGRQNRLGVTQH